MSELRDATSAPVLDREAVADVLREHTSECTGLGEVSCRGCRERGWMSWSEYRGHIADLIIALVHTPSTVGPGGSLGAGR